MNRYCLTLILASLVSATVTADKSNALTLGEQDSSHTLTGITDHSARIERQRDFVTRLTVNPGNGAGIARSTRAERIREQTQQAHTTVCNALYNVRSSSPNTDTP